jgi:phage terminase small subunit
MSEEKPLSAKQAQFVREYLIDLNATQAAIRAGYSAKNADKIGSELLGKTRVAQAVKEAVDARAKRTEITADYVLETIHDTIERCRQAKPVLTQFGQPVMVETPDGEIVPAYRFDPAAVLKGCELLGKHLKLFADRIEHSGPNGKPIEYSEVSDEQLRARIAEKLEKLKGEK